MLVKDQVDAPWDMERTVDPEEIARFTALAEEWWKPDGNFQTVHDFNAARLGYVLERIGGTFQRRENDFSGLRVLDIGCGAGLLCKPLAERGAKVVGIDATARNVEIARRHASHQGLDIDYRHCLAGHMLEELTRFDIVLNTEVVEHVADPNRLIIECCALLRPDRLLLVEPLNRTVRVYLLAILRAEYVLCWLP